MEGQRPIRYAVVGLGHISQVAVLPAFEHAEGSELVAIVSGDPVKRRELSERYEIATAIPYAELDELLERHEVDAVYIALPNHLHCDYAVRAAQRGVHVLCEKPLAVTEHECAQMILAAQQNAVQLMTASRLHFESANLRAIELARSGALGELRFFDSVFSIDVVEGDIRLNPVNLGGGPVYDLAVYCINAARYLFAEEPMSAFGAAVSPPDDPRWERCPETVAAILRFPATKLATFTVSFGTARTSSYRLVGTRGELRMHQAYEYAEPMRYQLFIEDELVREEEFGKRDQFAAEIAYFSRCVTTRQQPEPGGFDGLADVRIIRAIHDSIDSGRAIEIQPVVQPSRPDPSQEDIYPGVDEPETVHSTSPAGD